VFDSIATITPRGWRRCLRDRSAGVALMFAVSVFPITAVLGVAIDLGFITQSKAQLNAAADAAALAAATTAATAFTSGMQNYIALGQAAGSQWFSSQGTAVMETTAPTATVAVTQSGSVFVSTVNYSAIVTPYFSQLFGISTVPLSGLSSATISTQAYISVTFLLDNSSSMLIAATPAGVSNLNAWTPIGATTPNNPSGLTASSVPSGLGGLQCAFACHWDANGNDYYGLARKNNIQLRFDVVQSAVAAAIGQMITLELIPSQFSVGIYTFGTPAPNVLTKIYPANQTSSTDLADGATAAAAIQSPVVIDVANTDFPTAMVQLAQASPAAGDGSSTTSPKRALIIVTDGLADYGSRSIPTTEGPINPANCAAMKALGYSVYVLYTTYITDPEALILVNNTALYNYITVAPPATSLMDTSLASCASAPSNYQKASSPAAIATAMTQLLQAALGNGGRFTN
jgi:Flp pilus assembly protein TadG